MPDQEPVTANWTPEQLAAGKRWVETWRLAGVELERIKRAELRNLDTYRAIERLCHSGGPEPHPLRPTSGLVEQQRWFMKAAGRE
jgi:hypothetical protein